MSRKAELSQAQTRIRVVAGILINRLGEILVADRTRANSMRDYWEFPGGKLIDGESPERALRRELDEELSIEVVAARHFHYIEHDYTDLSVAIDFFLVEKWVGEPIGNEGQQTQWVESSRLREQNLLPADTPVIDALLASLNQN